MAGVKRWLAALAAGIMFFSGTAALSEAPGRDTVGIQESLVSREGTSGQTLEEQFLDLLKVLDTEEVRNLLKYEDVQEIFTEVIVKVIIWMAENRTATMKILTELGVGEGDRRCIGKIWDSAERISAVSREHRDPEDGKLLEEEFNDLMGDPDFQRFLLNLETALQSDHIRALSEAVKSAAESAVAPEPGSGPLAQEAVRQLGRENFTATLLSLLMNVADESEWIREDVPKLLKHEKLWTFMRHLTMAGSEVNQVLQEEFRTLTADPEVSAFLERTLNAVHAVGEKAVSLSSVPAPGNGSQENTEEAAP